MKRLLPLPGMLTMFLLFALFSCTGKGTGNSSRNLSPGDTASIAFTEYEHDFGKVLQGEKVACVFAYESKGTAPLVVYSASTSCGCTVTKYSTKPLAPGKKGTMEVEFDTSGRNGRQSKTITIRSNATHPVILLKITCEVTENNNN